MSNILVSIKTTIQVTQKAKFWKVSNNNNNKNNDDDKEDNTLNTVAWFKCSS